MSENPVVPDAEQAFDKTKHDALADAIEKLTPDEAAFFLWKLERSIRKRKVQLLGYAVAMLTWIVGMVFALAYYGLHDGFVGWAFLLPFALVGAILYGFGKWSERIAKATPPSKISVEAPDKKS